MADLFVGVTDNRWFNFLRERKPDEVNFWRPGGTNFKAIKPGSLFFFKLHAPQNKIAGFGVYVRYSVLPLRLAWEAFGEKNGVSTLEEFQKRISRYRRDDEPNPKIGCIILAQPVFYDDIDWIDQPRTWSGSIVQGKGYTDDAPESKIMYRFAEESLTQNGLLTASANEPAYAERMQRVRLGQGGFRVLVTEAYHRRCAVSGERTLPVLQAAHIKPYAAQGPHRVGNGLLLRADIHRVFDEGYLTITDNYDVEVSKRLREDYDNGRDYYKFHGQRLAIVPDSKNERPTMEFLNWHNDNVYRG